MFLLSWAGVTFVEPQLAQRGISKCRTRLTTTGSAWLSGWRTSRAGLSRRQLFRLSAGVGLAAIPALGWPGVAEAQPVAERSTPVVTASGPIVKPLPPELFNVFGSNAEMRWEAMRGQGYLVPIDRFFVRDHTSTPLLDADTWRLKLFGSGLRGAPTIDSPVEFTYQELRGLPAETVTAFVECAGNGRGFSPPSRTRRYLAHPGTSARSASRGGGASGWRPCWSVPA
jgi:DMSO/TMAO reductase YedYZ molybdopterin-dependent catalytic subunit